MIVFLPTLDEWVFLLIEISYRRHLSINEVSEVVFAFVAEFCYNKNRFGGVS